MLEHGPSQLPTIEHHKVISRQRNSVIEQAKPAILCQFILKIRDSATYHLPSDLQEVFLSLVKKNNSPIIHWQSLDVCPTEWFKANTRQASRSIHFPNNYRG